jgi:hypothetical protein
VFHEAEQIALLRLDRTRCSQPVDLIAGSFAGIVRRGDKTEVHAAGKQLVEGKRLALQTKGKHSLFRACFQAGK